MVQRMAWGLWKQSSYRTMDFYVRLAANGLQCDRRLPGTMYLQFESATSWWANECNKQKMGVCREAGEYQAATLGLPYPWIYNHCLPSVIALIQGQTVAMSQGLQDDKRQSGNKGDLFKSRMDFIHMCPNPYSFCRCCQESQPRHSSKFQSSWHKPQFGWQQFQKEEQQGPLAVHFFIAVPKNMRTCDNSFIHPAPVMFL